MLGCGVAMGKSGTVEAIVGRKVERVKAAEAKSDREYVKRSSRTNQEQAKALRVVAALRS